MSVGETCLYWVNIRCLDSHDEKRVDGTRVDCATNSVLCKKNCSKERCERLMSMLNLPKDELNEVEYEKMREFLCANSDVFALDDSELGCTNLVEHESIFPLNRVPFMYREKISTMID